VFPFLFKILFYGLAQGVVPIKTIDYFSTARNCYRGSCQIYYSFTFLFNTNRPRLVTLQKNTWPHGQVNLLVIIVVYLQQLDGSILGRCATNKQRLIKIRFTYKNKPYFNNLTL